MRYIKKSTKFQSRGNRAPTANNCLSVSPICAASNLQVNFDPSLCYPTFPTIPSVHSYPPKPCIAAPTTLPCSSRGQLRDRVWRPERKGASAPPTTIAGAFFASAVSCNGGCAWETFGSAGFLLPRFANLRTAATDNRLATVRGSSSPVTGAPPMKHSHALNPSATQQHAAALKARALAALRAGGVCSSASWCSR